MTTIHYDRTGNIAVLTIQSPPANALSSSLLADIEQTLNKIEQDDECKAAILRGGGKFFSAGADIKEFTSLQEQSDYENLSQKGQALFERIEDFTIPVIAVIHGAALGGGLELAMACHMRIATETAKLGLPEMTLGIIPGFGGTQRLPYYVGTPKAYEMILTGEPITGLEASRLGLVNFTTEQEDPFEEAKQFTDKIIAKSKPGIYEIMKLISHGKTGKFSKGFARESESFGRVFGSEDAKEGVAAFINKRPPHFIDK